MEKLKLRDVKQITLIKENEDSTKEYKIIPEPNKEIRNTLFADLAKENITIFELKKTEASLEDAFIDIIKKNEQEKEKQKQEEIEQEKKRKEEKEKLKAEKKTKKENKKYTKTTAKKSSNIKKEEPIWFNQEIKKEEMTAEEQQEIDDLLSKYR